jgi:hypothetical protein
MIQIKCTVKRSINCITQQIISNEIKTVEVGVAGGTYVTEKCIEDFGRNNLGKKLPEISVCIRDDYIKKDIEESEWETMDFSICLRTRKTDIML